MKLFLALLLTLEFLHSDELDNLLNTYTHNSDLSEKTKLENGGSVIVFTRKDLEIMQARTLKDLLKSNPLKRYTQSRFGVPDMYYKGEAAYFTSSGVRIYIDNQEITSATFGSGCVGADMITLDIIDHVEIYSNSPSYEFATEPTYLLIKLYSKTAERDRGGAARLSYGSRGFNEEVLSHAQEFQDFSYFASIFRTDDKKATYYSHDIPVKRDSEHLGLLASIYSKKHRLLLTAGKKDGDLSIASSPRATYATSTGDLNYFQIGYDTDFIDNLLFSIVYQQGSISGHRKEAEDFEIITIPDYPNELEVSRSEHALTTELKYTLESEQNRLIIGTKFRAKSFEHESIKINGIEAPVSNYDRQDIVSLFAEERYSISEHNIVNIAAHYTNVNNNADIDDADLWQFRLSHTYLYNDFIFKTFAYQTEALAEPYLYTDYPTTGSLLPKERSSVTEEIKYHVNDHSDFKLLLSYKKMKNTFKQSKSGGFVNTTYRPESLSGFLEYTHTFDIDNKITANFSYIYTYNKPVIKRETAAFVRSLNRVDKFDIFNELIFNHNKTTNKNYYDYSAGVKYRYSDDLTLSVKGENIFNTGYEESYSRVDPNTGIAEEPLLISPIEQRFYATVEYLF